MMRTRSSGLAAALALVLVAGCSSTRVDQDAVTPAVDGFDDVYSQSVEWGPCEPDLDGPLDESTAVAQECANISVPLDWNSPERPDRIDIAVLRVKGTGTTVSSSILVNPGGPGVEGRSLATELARRSSTESLRESYDLIGFDPRGFGESAPVTCRDTSSIQIVNFAQCVADNEISHFMGTSSVARDMDVIRVLIGDRRLNFFGYSYGTMLGATYATLFPDRVGRMVLDSAESAGWASVIHQLDQNLAISRALDRYVEACTIRLTAGVTCAFDSSESFDATTARLDAEPLVGTPGVGTAGASLSGDDLRSLMVGFLYMPPSSRAAALAIVSKAVQGDRAATDRLVAIAGSTSVGEAGQMVSCHSSPRVPDFVALAEHARELTGGSDADVDEVLIENGKTDAGVCSVLPETGTDITDRFSATQAQPILVVGITGDHATPYKYAGELVDELGNARLLTLTGDGHAASYGESTCIDAAVDRYFLDGVLPDEGTTCARDPIHEDMPDVRIDASPAGAPTLSGSSTPSERVQIDSDTGPDVPIFTDVSDTGTWGPVEVSRGCHLVRTVMPGSSSDPVSVCIGSDG